MVFNKQHNKNLVFSSIGDHSNHRQWLKGIKNFDVILVNYSNPNFEYQSDADYYFERRGGKFQNFHYIFLNHREILDQYDQFILLDDDIMIYGNEISQLFNTHKQYDLDISQPAFDKKSKISHPITLVRPRYLLRYTKFVENGCVLFNRKSIYKFMKTYEPVLIGYGLDFWFLNVIKNNKRNIAIIDEITCTNPYNFFKHNIREIDKLADKTTRMRLWYTLQKKYNLQEYRSEKTVFKFIKKPLKKLPKAYLIYYKKSLIGLIYKLLNKLLKIF